MKSQIIATLQKIMPPDAVIDIGIGAGLGEMHQWRNWHVPLALLIDANLHRVQWTKELIEKNNGWQLDTSLLSGANTEQDFFMFSNEAESGLLTIDTLQMLWPNMKLTEFQTTETQRLEDILSATSLQDLREAACLWSIVDCLPALPILKGTGAELEKWSVLWVRVILDDVLEKSHQDSHVIAITVLLESLGYRCIEIVEENNPTIGRALFVRDWHGQYVNQLLGDRTVQLKQLDAYEKQVKTLSATHADQLKQLDTYEKQVKTLSATYANQSKQIENYKKQIANLQQQQQEQDYRQQLLDEEFVKAEAQVELIKDVLLREK